MKTYKIINSDILFKGKLFPENSTINLDDKDASSLSAFLVTLDNSSPGCHTERSRSARDEGTSTSSTDKELKSNKRKK